jgi:hypothetical protein
MKGFRQKAVVPTGLGPRYPTLGDVSDGDDSIPNIFLIPFDLVFAQHRAQLVLKSNLPMMLLLSGDVFLHLFKVGLAHGEIRVAALPLEVGVIATAFFQPEVRDTFQFLHPFGLREGATEPRQHMHMIRHAADLDGRAIELFGDAAEIRVKRSGVIKSPCVPSAKVSGRSIFTGT